MRGRHGNTSVSAQASGLDQAASPPMMGPETVLWQIFQPTVLILTRDVTRGDKEEGPAPVGGCGAGPSQDGTEELSSFEIQPTERRCLPCEVSWPTTVRISCADR